MSEGPVRVGCALCGTKAKLEKSHVIPRFVYRGLQVPDGPTRALLCGACEDAFSGYESTFARVIFYPLLADSRLVAKYDKWLLKFSASVCWRVLEEGIATNQLGDSAGRWAASRASCRETWRRFLTGKRSDVGEHSIHLLPADRTTGAGTIEMAVRCNESEGFVHARLGPIILLGMISDPDAGQWRGTRVHLEGKIKPRETFVPLRYRIVTHS